MNLSRRTFFSICSKTAALMAAGRVSGLRVGCQANGYPLKEGDFSQFLDVLRQMRSVGYTGFECNIRFVKGQFDRTREARIAIESTGMHFIGTHTSLEQSLDDAFAQRAGSVAALGGERIVMSARGVAVTAEGRLNEPAVREKASRLEALAKIAKQSGIRIAYHNHNPEFANKNAEIEALARFTDPDLVEFLVDAGHAYLGGGDPAAFVTLHAKRVFGFHLKTFRGQSEQVPLGEGDFGFETLAAAVRKVGWSGWLITEEGGGPKPGNTAAVKPDREYIRRGFGA